MNAAAEMLASVGPAGTTITGVAQLTGLPTSSVYDYVLSERELIGAVAERGLDRIHLELVREIGSPATADELERSLSNALQLFLRRYEADEGLRESLAFVDADPLLMQINLADTRRNAELIHDALRPFNPRADLGSAVFLLTHLSGALAGLAARVSEDEAAVLIDEFQRLIVLLIDVR